jgi:hypothetical protein
VNKLIDFSEMHCAMIEALQSDAGSERFVIAYRNERSLHDLKANPALLRSVLPLVKRL